MPSFIVPKGSPLRADTFLAQNVPGWSRRIAQEAIEAGAVRWQSHATGVVHRLRKGDFAQGGDAIDVDDAWVTAPKLQGQPELQLPIVYEDDDIIVIDKPAGVASVALRLTDTGTAANFLMSRAPDLAGIEKAELEAGLLHRLDTNTSGLLLGAKTPPAYAELRRQFATRRVEKEYLAVAHGEIRAADSITTSIGHAGKRRDRMAVVGDAAQGRPASTAYVPIRVGRQKPAHTLLRVRIDTGVMHQIRVHLTSIGHPVVGDRLYGSPIELPNGRHLLHASRLAFAHPRTGAPMEVESAPPPDFEAFGGQ